MSLVLVKPVARLALLGAALPLLTALAVLALPGAAGVHLPVLATGIVIAALGALFGASLGRGQERAEASVQRVLKETQRVLGAARAGDLTQRLSTADHEGSLRTLSEALNALLDDVAETRAHEAEAAVATARIKQGLDVVDTNVMVSDADLNIVYVNQSIRTMLAEAEADIRKDVPAFNAAKVVGANIDVFHKNPAFQRGMLARLKQTHKARIAVGGRTFSLIVNPIDSEGERVGYVVEWKDLTAEIAAEAREQERIAAEKRLAEENLRIKNALDNVSTNVMIADNDRQIIYVNRSIVETLTRAESDLRRDLPTFEVRKLIGGSIDQFHKAPEHQRRVLDNLRTTHRAQIKVGGRTFLLTVNPILSGDGERLGTVVEWLDRTAEVSVESEIGDIVRAAANGDFSQRITLDGKEGFFRLLGENINELLKTSGDCVAEVGRMFSALAEGDLTQRIDADVHGAFAKLKDDANATAERLTSIILQIQQASDTINTAAREIAAGNSDLSARTEQQAANLEETASSMEELTSTVKQNAENARQANQLAIGASDVAVKGGSVVAEVVTTMSSISESSKKIADIIGVIDGIAFQTNILALNAAVEAARAGEQGRGFAVVASEVRNLAQRSAAAAKEIKALIVDSTDRVGAGAKLVEQAGRTMEEIVVSVKRVTDIMGEITAASLEQSQGIEQVNQTISQMDEVTQQNAALVEEASAAARSLEEQASGLAASVSRFRVNGSLPSVTPEPAPRVAVAAPVRPAPVVRPAVPKRGAPIATRTDEQWTEF